jgi:glycerol-3-phosphate dehydrogenase
MAGARAEVASTVEGVASASAIRELAHQVGIEVPIIEVMADAVMGTITPEQAMARLMAVSTLAEL